MPRAKSKARSEQQSRAREATTLQLSSLLDQVDKGPGNYTWWEVWEHQSHTGAVSYHSARTVTRDGRIGLLIDPGAHDNLVGERTMQALEHQLGGRARLKQLSDPLVVSGVGKQSQQADFARAIPCGVCPSESDRVHPCQYTAPTIKDSNLPPLLGMRSLREKRAIVDTFGKLLVLPGQGGVEFRCSPGTLVLPLDESESGHLILPLFPDPGTEVGSSAAAAAGGAAPASSSLDAGTRLDFTVQVRETRSLSPPHYGDRTVRGPYVREGDTIRTGRRNTRMTETVMRGFGPRIRAPSPAPSAKGAAKGTPKGGSTR